METGIEYPKLKLQDGREITVKFSRRVLYLLDKSGFDLGAFVAGAITQHNLGTMALARVLIRPSAIADMLGAIAADQGIAITGEEMSEQIPDLNEAGTALLTALGKTEPSVLKTIAGLAAFNLPAMPQKPEPQQAPVETIVQ